MILEKETFEEFGYYPSKLKPKSNKKILAKCKECFKIRAIRKCDYTDLCYKCAHIGKNPSFAGRYHTTTTKQTMSLRKIGLPRSEKTKNKISRSLSGENNSMYGKHHSEETKQKIGEGNRGKIVIAETRERMRANRCDVSGENNPMYGKFGKEHPAWKGGFSFEPYCPLFNNEFKERVREYFNRCCYICGKKEIENGKHLSVHHVNYNKDTCCDDSVPLFVPLCHSCHSKTNINREYWQEFFTISLKYLTNGQCYTSKNK